MVVIRKIVEEWRSARAGASRVVELTREIHTDAHKVVIQGLSGFADSILTTASASPWCPMGGAEEGRCFRITPVGVESEMARIDIGAINISSSSVYDPVLERLIMLIEMGCTRPSTRWPMCGAAHLADVTSAEKLHADDTSVPVLDRARGNTKSGRLWTYVRDDRPAASNVPPPSGSAPIIPVSVQGACAPEPHSLPDSIRSFAYLNAGHVRSDPEFHADIELLAENIRAKLSESESHASDW